MLDSDIERSPELDLFAENYVGLGLESLTAVPPLYSPYHVARSVDSQVPCMMVKKPTIEMKC